jgi:hypothetical protein
MPKVPINDPKHWRERAEEARTVADEMNDPDSKHKMLRIPTIMRNWQNVPNGGCVTGPEIQTYRNEHGCRSSLAAGHHIATNSPGGTESFRRRPSPRGAQHRDPGPADVHRAIIAAQRVFFDAPDFGEGARAGVNKNYR